MDILFCYMLIHSMVFILCENFTSTIKVNPKLFTQSDQVIRTKSLSIEGGVVNISDFGIKDRTEHNPLLVLDEEAVSGSGRDKPSVRRNGAVLDETIPPGTEKLPSDKENITTSSKEPKNNIHTEVDHKKKSVLSINTKSNFNNSTRLLKSNINITESATPKHSKPLILSSEALSDLDTKLVQHSNTVVKAESLKDQFDLNEESEITNKLYTANSKSHPDLVMPVVITILIVPLFAVVGYMALQKGREAWKNRHYKRMDFLLDGMYNE